MRPRRRCRLSNVPRKSVVGRGNKTKCRRSDLSWSGQYGFKPLDALHLAAAVEHGCTRFLSIDVLKKFPDILVELLL